MRVGYAKLGRAIHLDPASWGMQGDPAAPQLIRRLAERNPEHTFVVASKNDCAMEHLPANCENLWPKDAPRAQWRYDGPGIAQQPLPAGLEYERDVVIPAIGALDALILDLGQHGTSHMFIPQTKYTWAEARASFGGRDALDPALWQVDGAGHTAACDCDYTHPHAWARQYGASVINGMNHMGDRTQGGAPVIYICEDNRNYMKARDVKWPTGLDDVLAMAVFERGQVHERFRDPAPAPGGVKAERGGELWRATHKYRHGGCEMMILPDDWKDWAYRGFDDRTPAGVGSTSFWVPDPSTRRSRLILDWLMPAFPEAPVYGRWDKKCLEEGGGLEPIENDPGAFGDLLASWRVSIALPSIGRLKDGHTWTTGKQVQLMAAGAAAFHLGPVDSQGWVLPSRHRVHPAQGEVAPGLWSIRGGWTADELALAQWLRVDTPEQFAVNAKIVAEDRATWEWIAATQRALLEKRWDEALTERTIEFKAGL